jgi:modulator of FtsH protease HflK
MKKKTVFLLVVLLMVVLLATTVFYEVNYNQLALVKTFGKNSQPVTEAGLQVKWPWPVQRVVLYDTNTHIVEDALNQVKLADNNTVLLTMYCAWKIQDATKFDEKLDSMQRGEEAVRRLL